MRNIMKKMSICVYCGMIALCLSNLGCGDGPKKKFDLVEVKQTATINDLNVEQIRGEWWLATKMHYSGDVEAAARYYQATMAANATGLLYPHILVNDNGICNVRRTVGSGSVSSSSRITTAWHLVNSEQEAFNVGFGGYCTVNKKSDQVECEGLFKPVGLRNNRPEHKNPLLANRLFAFGLENWARDEAN